MSHKAPWPLRLVALCRRRRADVTTAKTPEERDRNARYQREYRARKAEQQATEVRGIFAHPEDHPDIKAHAAKLARKREAAQRRESRRTKPLE